MAEATSRLRLIIDSSDVRRATGDLDKFGRESGEAARSSERLERSSRETARAMQGLQNAVRALIGALAIREVLQFADAMQQTQNRLRLVTSSTEQLIDVQTQLAGVAQRTFNNFSATADLYSRLARSTEELGLSQSELIRVTETVNKTVAVSGASAQSAAAALFQLGQGLSAGALRGEELNSVLEQTPELARAIANGLGLSIAQLREFGSEGRLTAEAVIGALQSQAQAVDEQFAKLNPTIGQLGSVIAQAFQQEFIKQTADDFQEFADRLGDPATLQNLRTLAGVLGNIFNGFLKAVNASIDAFNDFVNLTTRTGLIDPLKLVIDEGSIREVERQLERLFQRQQRITLLTSPGAEFAGSPQLLGEQTRIRDEVIRLTEVLRDLQKGGEDTVEGIVSLGKSAKETATELKKIQESRAQFESQSSQFGFGRFEGDIASARSRSEVDSLREEIVEFLVKEERRFEELARTGAITEERANELRVEALETAQSQLNELQQIRGGLRGLSLTEAIEISADSIRDIADSISAGINQAVSVLTDPNSSFLEKIGGASDGFGGALRGIGESLGNIGGGIAEALGPLFNSAGAIGQAIGAVVGLIGSIKSLFGTQSSGGTFDPRTGQVSFERTSVSDERNQSRNQLGQTTVDIANQIAEIIGADFREGVGIRIFIDRNDQLLASLRDLNTNAQLALPNGVTREDRGNTSSPEVAVRQGVNLLIANALEGGDERLARYARAAAAADIETEELVNGLNSLKNVFDLTAEPLSNVERQLQAIDDAVEPAIDALKSVGQSFAEITQIANEAARAVGEAFIGDIQDDILSFRNATLGDFKRLLDDQERLINDAKTLLERGAITPEEFDLVQVRNSLERENFFQSLSAEELESLGDFFGLIENSGGSVAVILTQLQSAFSDFVDNVAETREELQAQADQLANAARTIFDTRDDILQRFPRQSGGALLNELRGQLGNLREQAFAGDNTAFEKIPEVANQLVELARAIFGSTTQFAEQRDFALNILDQTGGLAQSRSDKLLTEIEALNTQVEVLNDIRDALESPDPAVELIQAQLNQGAITNDLIRQLLEQYIALTAEARAGAITPTEAQGAAEGFFNAGGARSTGTPTVTIDKFDDSLVILLQVRTEIARGNAETARILQGILNEQKRAGATSALTG